MYYIVVGWTSMCDSYVQVTYGIVCQNVTSTIHFIRVHSHTAIAIVISLQKGAFTLSKSEC